MASITGTQISTNVGLLLNDIDSVRWKDAERLAWINEGRREMATIKPTVFGSGTEVSHTLTAGCKQTIGTAGAYHIASVDSHNSTSVRETNKNALSFANPNWRTETASVVEVWFTDETDPLSFWVYPASTGTLMAHVHITPADLTSLTEVALPFDIYAPALVNYVCAKALAKEDEAGSLQKAQAFASLFLEALK